MMTDNSWLHLEKGMVFRDSNVVMHAGVTGWAQVPLTGKQAFPLVAFETLICVLKLRTEWILLGHVAL